MQFWSIIGGTMKKKRNINTSIVKRIEIDKDSNQPVVVEVPEAEFLNQPIEKADFVATKSGRRAIKKETAEKVFGIKPDQDNIDKRQKMFKKISTIVFIVFMVGVLAYTAYKDFFVNNNTFPSVEQLKEILSKDWLFFFLAILALVLSFFFKGLKNVFMCKAMTGKAHFITSMETAIIGTYYNNVTPLAVGGQPFEIYHLSKHGVHGGVASSIPIASFFMNQLAFVLLGIFALVSFNTNLFNMPSFLLGVFPPAFYTLTIIGLCCCLFVPSLVIVFSILPKVGAKLVYLVIKIGRKLRIVKKPQETLQKTIKTVVHNSHCLKKIASRPILFLSLFLLSFLENIASSSIAFFVLKGFGFNLGLPFITEWAIICCFCFILFASITFIPTPGNSGAADLSFFKLFEEVLLGGLAFPAMLIWRLFSFYATIMIGFTFATLKKRYDAKKAKNQPLVEEVIEEPTLSEKEEELYQKITDFNNKSLE